MLMLQLLLAAVVVAGVAVTCTIAVRGARCEGTR